MLRCTARKVYRYRYDERKGEPMMNVMLPPDSCNEYITTNARPTSRGRRDRVTVQPLPPKPDGPKEPKIKGPR